MNGEDYEAMKDEARPDYPGRHDRLCAKSADPYSMKSCECGLIREVREDEARTNTRMNLASFDDGYAACKSDALAALAAAGHTRYGIYDECECPDEVREQEGHLIYLEEFAGCEKSLVYWGCRECCTDDGYHSEACATYHDHGEGKPWCNVVAAIEALGGER